MHCTLDTQSGGMASNRHQPRLSQTLSCVPGTSYTVIAMHFAFDPTFSNAPIMDNELSGSNGATQRSLSQWPLTVAAAAREQQHTHGCLLAFHW